MIAKSLLLFCILCPIWAANAFSVNSNILRARSIRKPSYQRVDIQLEAFALDTFFQTDPYLAAFLTCSLKASAADWVAQSQQHEQNFRRNLAFILYGGFYQGCVQAFIYSALFPAWFPDPSLQNILTQVSIDLFILGPMISMPTVYTMKALLAGEESNAGIEKYLDHVQTKGILFRYWSIWGPIQTLNFGIIPHHLRVVFVAMVSFFWICLLSTVSSSESEATDAAEQQSPSYPAMPQGVPIPIPVLAHQSNQQPKDGLAHVTSS